MGVAAVPPIPDRPSLSGFLFTLKKNLTLKCDFKL